MAGWSIFQESLRRGAAVWDFEMMEIWNIVSPVDLQPHLFLCEMMANVNHWLLTMGGKKGRHQDWSQSYHQGSGLKSSLTMGNRLSFIQ